MGGGGVCRIKEEVRAWLFEGVSWRAWLRWWYFRLKEKVDACGIFSGRGRGCLISCVREWWFQFVASSLFGSLRNFNSCASWKWRRLFQFQPAFNSSLAVGKASLVVAC